GGGLGDAVGVGARFGDLGDPGRLGVDKDDCGDHGTRLRRGPDAPDASQLMFSGVQKARIEVTLPWSSCAIRSHTLMVALESASKCVVISKLNSSSSPQTRVSKTSASIFRAVTVA